MLNAQATTASPTCGPAWTVGARSGATTGTGGSDALSLLASTDLPAGRRGGLPRGRDARGSRLRRVSRDPTRQVPEGRPDTYRARRRLGAHPREGEALPAVRPGPTQARVRAQAVVSGRTWSGASSRGRPAGRCAASGYSARMSPRRGSCATLRRRTPSRSPAGGGGACRTWARRPRSSSWTPTFRMEQTRQVSCWMLS